MDWKRIMWYVFLVFLTMVITSRMMEDLIMYIASMLMFMLDGATVLYAVLERKAKFKAWTQVF